MTRHLLALMLLACGASAHADAFETADGKTGKKLVEQHCTACHVAKFGGDGSGVYMRTQRKIKSAEQLTAQIGRCDQAAGTQLSTRQQRDIGAHLNQAYYGFR